MLAIDTGWWDKSPTNGKFSNLTLSVDINSKKK